MNDFKIALIQTTSDLDLRETESRTVRFIEEAAAKGARVICLQELFQHPYFCREQDPQFFDLAETIPGKTTHRFSEVVKRLEVFLVLPLFEKVNDTVFYNSVVVLNPKGEIVSHYRKMHIPQDPGFEEKFFFSPGDLDWPVFDTPYGKMGVLVCWDQWYPEAARLMALKGAKVIFFPTAIGKLHEESEELAIQQHQAWETVQRGHGVANGCYIAACNRVGTEGNLTFWGQSFVSGPYGSIIARASHDAAEVLVVDLDSSEQEEFRRIWPFFRDRRVDAYGDILKRVIESDD
ncbi:MAG: carbon-nitrogen hydrolase [Opitutales bacterium]|nr:carbon-nitrogen hydrolase [Opitutales bacterium]